MANRLVLFPRKFSAIDNDTPKRCSMSAHELRQRMHDDIGAVFDWLQQDWSCHGIVHDEWNTVTMGNAASASMSHIFPAGLPMLSQNTARVFSSINFSIAAERSVRRIGPLSPVLEEYG